MPYFEVEVIMHIRKSYLVQAADESAAIECAHENANPRNEDNVPEEYNEDTGHTDGLSVDDAQSLILAGRPVLYAEANDGDEVYPVDVWQNEAAQGETLLGYWDWVEAQREQARLA